jgi:hypothetical protein
MKISLRGNSFSKSFPLKNPLYKLLKTPCPLLFKGKGIIRVVFLIFWCYNIFKEIIMGKK